MDKQQSDGSEPVSQRVHLVIDWLALVTLVCLGIVWGA